MSIAIITLPILYSGINPLSNLIDVLLELSGHIYLITGNEGNAFKDKQGINCYGFTINFADTKPRIIFNYLLIQLYTSIGLIKIIKKIDVIFFYFGEADILPMVLAKLFRRKVIIVLGGDLSLSGKLQRSPLAKITSAICNLSLSLTDRIIVYSKRAIKDQGLEIYKEKILVTHKHFLNFDKFYIINRLGERDNVVGYIGRLSAEKGIVNFLDAAIKLSQKNPDIKFLIIGDGDMRIIVENSLKNHNNFGERVTLTGWISHDEIPYYLNKMKLIVLPSFTEGLPNVMLESMACGTPVLVTEVGAVPDVIRDGETGFIMESNSPECIEYHIMRSLTSPHIDGVVKEARLLVENEFNYQHTVELFENAVGEIFR